MGRTHKYFHAQSCSSPLALHGKRAQHHRVTKHQKKPFSPPNFLRASFFQKNTTESSITLCFIPVPCYLLAGFSSPLTMTHQLLQTNFSNIARTHYHFVEIRETLRNRTTDTETPMKSKLIKYPLQMQHTFPSETSVTHPSLQSSISTFELLTSRTLQKLKQNKCAQAI